MSRYHNLAGRVPEVLARCIREMEEQIFSLQAKIAEMEKAPAKVRLSKEDITKALSASGLIGAYAQPVIGGAADPILASVGTGTVSNITVTGDSNISVSGSPITTSGTIALTFVLGSGWAAATGTADRTTFDTTTVTLSELAERVKALIDDLI